MARVLVPLLLVALAAGCGESPGHDHDHDHAAEHAGHDAEHAAGGGHAHAPRMGGTLIELGDHELQLEAVLDADAGTLTVYVWDGHVEHPVRTEADTLPAVIGSGDDELRVELAAQADPLTGETAGDSARFSAGHERFAGAERVSGRLGPVRIAGRSWGPVEFTTRAAR